MADKLDVVIIGGGPGGYAAALYGAAAGLSVGLIERDLVGGTCLHRGCIPTKQLLETANVLRTVRSAKSFGVAGVPDLGVTVDLPTAQEKKAKTVDSLHRGLQGLLGRRKIRVISGAGAVEAGGRVRVTKADGGNPETIEAGATIIATGASPRSIPAFEFDGSVIISSDEALALDELPARVAVIGAGAIGLELSSFFADCGSEVMLLEALPQVLPGADTEMATFVERRLGARLAGLETGAKVTGYEPIYSNSGGATVKYTTSKGADEKFDAEKILVAVGRRPVTEGLGLDSAGVRVDGDGYIEVDKATMRTDAQDIYAVGDVVRTPALAHVAFAEGMVAIRSILGEDPAPVDYGRVPVCIYSNPEVAFAGMTEDEARQAHGGDAVVAKHRFGGVGRALIIGEPDGIVKVVARRDGPILGVHIAGPWASELIVEGYIAVNWEALPSEVAALIHPHPTLSEAFGEALLAMGGRGLHG